MLLPMLSIYQEYVRNHHYSLQVLAECKQSQHFGSFLNRLESRPQLQGRTLETFLTYPMHQIPRYIITLHELLAHTPHNHVERKSLDHARMQLEDLSRQMHDEVSETENIRKNLAIERMIVEGCDILLDVNQMFVRQGSLIQIIDGRTKNQKPRLGQFKSDKEAVRQCFLFSNHLIVATRTSGGKLHLVSGVGKIPLQEATLIEDPNDGNSQDDDGESSVCSTSSQSSGISESSGATSSGSGHGKSSGISTRQPNLDFKIIVEQRNGSSINIHLVAPTMQEKQAWISDISQCLDNVHFNNLFRSSMSDTSSVTMPHSIKNDPRLFRDDVDIRFSRTLNSCKVPHIRYATPERLLERLTDLRFLSIDFLNTFLLTYRVFTDGVTVLEALKKVYYNPDIPEQSDSRDSSVERSPEYISSPPPDTEMGIHSPRRVSTFSAFSEKSAPHALPPVQETTSPSQAISPKIRFQEDSIKYSKHTEQRKRNNLRHSSSLTSESRGKGCLKCGYINPSQSKAASDSSPGIEFEEPRKSSWTIDTQVAKGAANQHWRWSYRRFEEEQRGFEEKRYKDDITTLSGVSLLPTATEEEDENSQEAHPPDQPQDEEPKDVSPSSSASNSPRAQKKNAKSDEKQNYLHIPGHTGGTSSSSAETLTKEDNNGSQPPSPSHTSSGTLVGSTGEAEQKEVPKEFEIKHYKGETVTSGSDAEDEQDATQHSSASSRRRSSGRSQSATSSHLFVGQRGRKRMSTESEFGFSSLGGLSSPRSSVHTATPRSSFQVPDSSQHSVSRVGVVITSSRQSQRRSSSASAAAAFAVATAGSSNPRDLPKTPPASRFSIASDGRRPSFKDRPCRQESIISTAATMRVLNVLRHWVSKHWQDFENDSNLCQMTIEFLEDLVCCPTLLPAEHKAASQLLRLITNEEPNTTKTDLDSLLAPPSTPSKENIETLSALAIAEQMTYIDHQIFVSIRSEEFLKTAWTKLDKQQKAPHILIITKRFNEMSRLVVSEIFRRTNMPSRISVIEKWVAVADICRVLHNFNGVLQVCAAFQNSSVYRLKKTWEKVSKTTRQTLEKLQALVSADGRFRSLRDALHRCDPPCIPYLGMYLTDLSFIEEGTPNFTEEGLLNFSKMRMIAHVIREIRHFQQTPYKIEYNPRVWSYLLDTSLLYTDDELYKLSLEMEPRRMTLAHVSVPSTTGSLTPTSTSSS